MGSSEDNSIGISDIVRENYAPPSAFSVNSGNQAQHSQRFTLPLCIVPKRNRDYRSRHCDYDKGMR